MSTGENESLKKIISHLQLALRSAAIGRNQVEGTELDGSNLVVKYKIGQTPHKLNICFQSVTDARLAEHIVKTGYADIGNAARDNDQRPSPPQNAFIAAL